FAFSVPSVNRTAPAQRYHWVVLLQGMRNLPTMCQIYVAWALEPVRNKFPQLLIYHYTDDILAADYSLAKISMLSELTDALESRGLKLAPEKVQQHDLWKYLGWTWIIEESRVKPQKTEIKTDIQTLNDVQKLVGDLQWVRTLCGITNDDLKPLVQLLGTSTQANDKRSLGPEQFKALQEISEKNC
ncbi:POK18 protein, partial [Pteruthius melanotis]|nr:POK18 protein [Pteruthius melanotis]